MSASRKVTVTVEIEDENLHTESVNDLAFQLRDALVGTANLIEWGARRVMISSNIEAV